PPDSRGGLLVTATRFPSPGEALALFVAGVVALAAAGATPPVADTPAESTAVTLVAERQAAPSAPASDLGVAAVVPCHPPGCADPDRPEPYVPSADDFFLAGCYVPGEEWVTLSAGALDPTVPWESVAYLLRHEAGHVAAFEAGCYSTDLTVEQHERLADA